MRAINSLSFLALGLIVAGCSANSEDGSPYGGTGNTGGSAAAGGSGATGGGGSGGGTIEPDAGGGGDALPVNPEASADTVMPDGDTCHAQSVDAEPFPLDMYVMMDQSGSMGAPVVLTQPFGPTQWDAVKDAFVGFLSNSPPDGMSMGIQYFPLPVEPWSSIPGCSGGSCPAGQTCATMDGAGEHCMTNCSSDANCHVDSECMSFDDGNGGTIKICSNDTCNVGEYANPDVPIGPIPGVNSDIIASLEAHAPMTMTPTAPALEGAIQYAKGWASQHPGHTTIVVFATDGMPTACTGGGVFPINEVKAIAADGLSDDPAIKTFVVGVAPAGMPNSLNNLHGIADAGGTGQAFIVQAGNGMADQLAAALEAIRGAFMLCEFQIPDTGYPLEYGEVNVVYTATNGTEHTVYYVGDPANCDPVKGGWYYDVDPSVGDPTKILLCPQSCDFVQDHAGSISIEIGCETITPPK